MNRRERLRAIMRDLDAIPEADRTLSVQSVIGGVRALATKQEPATDGELRMILERAEAALDIDNRNRGEKWTAN